MSHQMGLSSGYNSILKNSGLSVSMTPNNIHHQMSPQINHSLPMKKEVARSV